MTTKAFRILVLISIVVTIGVIAAEVTATRSLPDPLRAYRKATEEQFSPTMLMMVLGAFSVVLLGMIGSIGLLFLWRPARILYTLATVLAFPLALTFGPNVTTALSHFLTIIGTFLNGVIFALIYFSPLKEEFDDSGEPSAP